MLIRKRIWDSIQSLNLRPGARVLEVGVGTGISLGAYPRDIHITGIDLSEEMLAVAQRKIEAEGWDQIKLLPMNAEQLDFPDGSFDCVTAFHVVSVVSQPQKMMREITRVLRPGGKMLLINHFRSGRRWIANVIDRADPVTRHLGWRTDLELDAVVDSLPLKIEKRYKTSPLSLFTVLQATRTAGEQE
ncbi:class I SAM-dependent methyltransferase [Candidatus Laterigemmans baculatus]|uniref:class I SAM-dependent methyltransferase n=1 Tax=Candidatus Laterigemmans baculatus TaxID=2770505 RepID=UPI001F1722EC|nr:class I SAM-dependent methyltransferase [Candidatus Laterigemmans baculatus]